MSIKNVCAALIGMSLVLSGCTGRGAKGVQVDNQNPGNRIGNGGTQQPVVDANNTGEVPVVLNKKEMEAYNINTANLRYKFTYLTATQEDAITFDASGNARLTFKNLPAEQTGTLTLEILEGTVVKLRGSAANVVLKKGQNNNISLRLAAVDPNGGGNGGNGGNGNGGNGQSTDLTIDVTLDNNGGGNPPPPPPAQPPTQPPPPPAQPPAQPPTDPVADWDGKSFKGNARWTIVPVQG